jgi:UDP-N-acetylglucosamine--N-acetylmuramyl-(pentapeptide) pyrophosphoryl-undecaprenol N-acetylglucosamine transferase
MPTVLVASGGTGGHLYPAIALADELVRRRASMRIAFVGAGRRAGRDAAVEHGFEWHTVPGRGMPRGGALGLVPFAWDLLRGVLASRKLVRRLRPDVAIGFGNYASVAPLYAAYRRRVPIVIHEANAVPGRANRLLARYANAVAVHFAEAGEALKDRATGRIETVGMPVRAAILEPPDPHAARRAYGLDEGTFTLLVVGGSQGAARLNEVVCEALAQLERLELPVQVIHLCGRGHDEPVRRAYETHRVAHAVHAFEADMARAYAAADCALCRAGAATLAELAATSTPSLLVPYPFATEGHQAKNADAVARAGAARVVPQQELGAAVLVEYVRQMQDAQTREAMSRHAHRIAHPDAAQRLADLVEEYIG